MNTGMKKGGVIKGFVPETFEDIQRCAALAVNAGHFNVLNDDKSLNEAKSIANATLAIMQGMESGMPVVMSIQLIAVINGRCSIFGEAIPALIWRGGHTIKEWIQGEGDARVAYCEITRADSGEVITRTFSVKDAKTANLWDPAEKNQWGKPNKSTWHCYPERMLQMRARGFCARDAVPDVLTGLYVREEMEDVVGRDEPDALPPREKPAAVALPPAEMIEDKPVAALPAPAEEPMTIELPKAEENIYAQKVHVELPRAEPAAAASTRIDTPKQAADWAASKNPEQKRRGRPPKAQAPVDEPAPEPEEESPENVVRLFKLKFVAAQSADDLNLIYDEACEVANDYPRALKFELEMAYNAAFDKFDTKGASA